MKPFLFFSGLLLFITLTAHSQGTVIFHEDFGLPSLGDSVISTQQAVSGIDDWGNNNRVSLNGNSSRCDSCQVKTGHTTYLTTVPFSTTGTTSVVLTFNHICKVDPLDIATLEVSNDGGLTWTFVPCSSYLGAGSYCGNGNKFGSGSYGAAWSPASPIALPINTWWRMETFDLSQLIGNSPNARIRFKLSDGGPPGPGGNPTNVNNNRGWYITNISIKDLGSTISGHLRYANSQNTPLINVNINLLQNGNLVGQTQTDISGNFQFMNLPLGQYTIQPLCTKPWGGVNAVDALRIMKHFVGLISLSGLPALAADVDLSNYINSSDAYFVAERYVGITNGFPLNDWVYWDTSITINTPATYNIFPTALCAGDVNGSYVP